MVTDNKQIDEREVRFEDMPAMLLKLSDHMKMMSEHIIWRTRQTLWSRPCRC